MGTAIRYNYLTGFVLVLLMLALAACAPAPTGSTMNSTVLPTTASTSAPTSTPAADTPNTPQSSELPPIKVANVEVQIGVGSPIPVDAFISAELPDICAQLAEVKSHLNGFKFEITLSVTPGLREECLRDTLPFRMYVPLNMVNLPDGMYTVIVNGVSTAFNWPSGPTITPEPAMTTPSSLVRYQGPNPYRSSPAFSVDYDPSVWEFVEKDGSGLEPKLNHRGIPKCTLWLGAGPVGAQPVSNAQIGGYDWAISLVQPEIVMYSTPWDDIAFIFGLTLPEPYTSTVKSPCQQALEDVLETFKIAAN